MSGGQGASTQGLLPHAHVQAARRSRAQRRQPPRQRVARSARQPTKANEAHSQRQTPSCEAPTCGTCCTARQSCTTTGWHPPHAPPGGCAALQHVWACGDITTGHVPATAATAASATTCHNAAYTRTRSHDNTGIASACRLTAAPASADFWLWCIGPTMGACICSTGRLYITLRAAAAAEQERERGCDAQAAWGHSCASAGAKRQRRAHRAGHTAAARPHSHWRCSAWPAGTACPLTSCSPAVSTSGAALTLTDSSLTGCSSPEEAGPSSPLRGGRRRRRQ